MSVRHNLTGVPESPSTDGCQNKSEGHRQTIMTRVIKLQPVYIQKKHERTPRIVPKLILSGKWLFEAGFQSSELVHVKVENGKLTIVNA